MAQQSWGDRNRQKKFQQQQNLYAAQTARAAASQAETARQAALPQIPPGTMLSPSGEHVYIKALNEWKRFARNQSGVFWFNDAVGAWETLAAQTQAPGVVVNVDSGPSATAEQVKAVASGTLADALRELNKLRYDRLLTDEEFTVLKNKLLTDYA